MKEWSNLPNAKHIDCVLQSIKDNPDEWAAAWNAALAAAYYAARDAAWNAAYDAVWDAAGDVARDVALDAARDAAWGGALDKALYKALDLVRYEAWIAGRSAAWIAGRSAAADAILALVAYDDSVKYLSMTYEELKVWATLSEEPASILLLPMVKAKELISKKTTETVT